MDRGPWTVDWLAASHAIATVEAFIAGAAADGYVTTSIAGGCITLHAFSSRVHSIYVMIDFFYRLCPVCFQVLRLSIGGGTDHPYFTQFMFPVSNRRG